MRFYKSYFPIFIACILFFSCSKYAQMYETRANVPVVKENDHFVFENDTVKIAYDFWADEGQISFEIFNKLSIPIYIDWKKSLFFVNNTRYDYWSGESYTHIESSGEYRYFRDGWLSSGNSVTIKPERFLFLTPQSFVRTNRFRIFPKKSLLDDNSPSEEIVIPQHPTVKANVKYKEFDISNSPLVFKNFITIALDEKSNNETFIDNSFFVSKISQMKRKKFFTGSVSVNNRIRLTSTLKNPTSFYVNL
ncbi:hypothetical protein ACX0G9_23365 [Flavitalea flava]